MKLVTTLTVLAVLAAGACSPTGSARGAPKSSDLTYPDSSTEMWKRFESVGWKGLTDTERVFHCVWWLEAEVNNGGFDQFFYNSAGDHTAETLRSLERIGAPRTKALLQKAIATVFGDKQVPTARSPRQDLLLSVTGEDTPQDRALNELDLQFCRYQEDLSALMNRWLESQGARAVQEPAKPWPFADPKNTAVFTTKPVLDDRHPILQVTHEKDDGAWQFLCGTTNRTEDARVVGLGSITKLDPSLLELADLPLGWSASRTSQDAPWTRVGPSAPRGGARSPK